MGKWILLALLALLILVLTSREGFQDTNGIKGVYDLDGTGADKFTGSSAEHLIEFMPATLITALQAVKPKHPCPTPADQLKQCPADPTTGSGAMQLIGGDINNIMVAFYLTVYKRSNAAIDLMAINRFLSTYPMTPFLTANKDDVTVLLLNYFVTQPHGVANTGTNDPRFVNDIAPDPATTSPELVARWNADHAATVRAAAAAATSGYAGLIANDPLAHDPRGPAPTTPIDERSDARDSGSVRPMNGPVFGDNGPFSGQSGTGQGSAMNAAATLTGSSYAHPPPTEARLDPYDFWPGTSSGSNQPTTTGISMDVRGPTWGGRASGSGNSTPASVPMTAKLYGPDPKGPQVNNMMPSYDSAGSDPSNQYFGTSRVPGDKDLFPDSYSQSTTYSLANGSQKTEPVPFLTDFSVFQS